MEPSRARPRGFAERLLVRVCGRDRAGFAEPGVGRRGIRSLLVAGLVTSTCVLFTASTAAQRGYLESVDTDCCSDREEAHHATLTTYPFVFDTVRSDQIAERRAGWDADLDRLDDGATTVEDRHDGVSRTEIPTEAATPRTIEA